MQATFTVSNRCSRKTKDEAVPRGNNSVQEPSIKGGHPSAAINIPTHKQREPWHTASVSKILFHRSSASYDDDDGGGGGGDDDMLMTGRNQNERK